MLSATNNLFRPEQCPQVAGRGNLAVETGNLCQMNKECVAGFLLLHKNSLLFGASYRSHAEARLRVVM
jgi:hypothetical protein